MKMTLLFLAASAVVCSSLMAQVAVRGYTRQDGTYVQPHTRTAPDGNIYNNRSYSGAGNTLPAYSRGTGSNLSDLGAGGGLGQTRRSGSLYEQEVRQPSGLSGFGNQGSGLGRTYTPSGNENTGRVQVDGHLRNNGTYVQPYTRTAPNRTDDDNWSKKGNLNLDTGKPGYRKDNPWK